MRCLPRHLIVLRGRALLATMLLLHGEAAGSLRAQTPRDGPATLLRTIRVVTAEAGGATSVVLESDGALPEPRIGALDNPARVYLDFEGVRPAPRAAEIVSNSLVRRTRVAINTTTPLVTRVVIDLFTRVPYTIDASGRQAGRLVVWLDSPALSTVIREKPAAPVARRSAAADAYDGKAALVLGRLQALRPVLAAIDRREENLMVDLDSIASELEALGATFGALKPPPARQTTHALILRACAFAARAARLREESSRTGDVALIWPAASAAAGALLMADSAAGDLGPPKLK